MRASSPVTLHGSLLPPAARGSDPRKVASCPLCNPVDLSRTRPSLRPAGVADPTRASRRARQAWWTAQNGWGIGHTRPFAFSPEPRTREQQLRQSVLLTLCESLPQSCSQFEGLSLAQWQRLLLWLDYHGLALYFSDRLSRMESLDLIPASVLESLDCRLQENSFERKARPPNG